MRSRIPQKHPATKMALAVIPPLGPHPSFALDQFGKEQLPMGFLPTVFLTDSVGGGDGVLHPLDPHILDELCLAHSVMTAATRHVVRRGKAKGRPIVFPDV